MIVITSHMIEQCNSYVTVFEETDDVSKRAIINQFVTINLIYN